MASLSTVPDDEYTTEIHQVKIVVPSIVKKGGKFQFMHHGKRHILQCPPNVGGNDMHVFDVEVVLKIEDLPVAHNVVHVSHSTKTQDHLVDPDSLANAFNHASSMGLPITLNDMRDLMTVQRDYGEDLLRSEIS